MRPTTTLRDALSDPRLLGHVLSGPSWLPWRALLIASMGEPLTDEERAVFTKLTGREREPLQRCNEVTIVAGRRGGKTSAIAAHADYIATCCDHTDALARGETGIVLCIAQSTDVAKKLIEFALAYLEDSEILRQLIKSHSSDTIELTNNIRIEVRPASFRKLRGPTYVAVICDELAFWFTEASYANPDVEVLAACRPGLITTRGPLIMASSPYARMGVLWDTFRRHYGPDGAPLALVARGATRDFNSTISQSEIDRELERDRPRNTAEYLAEFRSDLEGYVSLDAVERCVGDYREIPPSAGIQYKAFVDPSSGAEDSFTLAIAHREERIIFIDAIREIKAPFRPTAAIAELAAALKSYRIFKVVGDRYAGLFPRDVFSKHGVYYEVCKRSKSEIYTDFLPQLNSTTVTLPRSDRLIHQLVTLERTVGRGTGRENIDHPRGMHDDLANAVAGAAVLAATPIYDLKAMGDGTPAEPSQRPFDERHPDYLQALRGHIMATTGHF